MPEEDVILRNTAQMTYQRTILLRIQKLDGKAYGWEDTIACERRLEWQYRGAASGGDGGGFGAARSELADDWREK